MVEKIFPDFSCSYYACLADRIIDELARCYVILIQRFMLFELSAELSAKLSLTAGARE